MKLKTSLLQTSLLQGLVVLNFAGHPTVELKDGSIKPTLKENLNIKSDAYFRTHENEYLIMKINNFYQVTVLPNSVFTLEGVKQKEAFDVRSVYIRSGLVHILELPQIKVEKSFYKEGPEPAYEAMKIDSDFFSILTQDDQKLSLFVSIDPKTALLEVCNLSQDFKLDLFDHEVSQKLKRDEAIQFQGVLDKSGKVAYDLLLEKRKVPQGKWLERKPCSVDQIKKIQSEVEKNQLSEAQKIQKNQKARQAQKKKDDARFLCHKPYGQLDQCHFVLKQNKCFRERCNAEGKWAESTEVGRAKNLCTTQGDVRACGY